MIICTLAGYSAADVERASPQCTLAALGVCMLLSLFFLCVRPLNRWYELPFPAASRLATASGACALDPPALRRVTCALGLLCSSQWLKCVLQCLVGCAILGCAAVNATKKARVVPEMAMVPRCGSATVARLH